MEMSSKMQKNPSIRFKGFTDAWEQRKLIEEADFFDEKRIPIDSEKRVQGRYPYYGATGVIDYVDNYIFDGEYILLAEDGANIITRNSPVAYITEGKFWLNNHAHIMKMKLGSNLFLLQLLERQNYEKFNSGTAQPKLNGQIVKNMIFNFPSYKEQNKIGNFFKLIDEAIALHQRKLTLLKQLKQTYLKQIFPQNKENMPALRFAGFSEPWKQSKFDEVFSHVQNNSLSRADLNYKSGYAMNIHYGDILIRFGEYLDVSKYQLPMIANKQLVEKYKSSILKDGDIVIADAAEDETVGKCSELGGIEDANILAGLHTIPSRPNWTFASGYLGYYMNSSAFHDQLLPLIQGTKISSISKSALKKTDIKYPHGKDEQTKIGNLFKQLDDSIALHQSKLEKLMDLKQVLLVKMFV